MNHRVRPISYRRQRFMSLVSKDSTSGCWNWAGQVIEFDEETRRGGYGLAHVAHDVDGGPRKTTAHRAAWRIFVGPIPDDQFVCHKCDNRRCVNPDHLFLGSASDNTRDMIAKNRHPSHMRPRVVV